MRKQTGQESVHLAGKWPVHQGKENINQNILVFWKILSACYMENELKEVRSEAF